MKNLILIRHAKSSWTDADLNDFDRPLNERGKQDAPEMAKRLKDRKIDIDLFVSSPAKRAKRTARFFAEEYGLKKDDIKLQDELYLATQDAFWNSINHFKNKYNCIALFSHNPGISELANSLTTTKVDEMPTCSIFAVEGQCESWKDFKSAPKRFLFFDFPKNNIVM